MGKILIAFVAAFSCLAHAGALHDAVEANDEAKVLELLDAAPASVNELDEDGNSPLHFATNAENINLVRILLERGADLEQARRFNGDTAFFIAVGLENVELVTLFLGLRVINVNRVSAEGFTALHQAAAGGNIAILSLLIPHFLEAGALDALDHGLTTAVYYAAANGHIDFVRLLLINGADATLADEYGLTAADVAAENGHDDIVEVITNHLKQLRKKNPKRKRGSLESLVFKHFKDDDGTDDEGADDCGAGPALPVMPGPFPAVF